MANYTDSATVTKRLKNRLGNNGAIDTDTMTEALQSADDLINGQLDEQEISYPTVIPSTIHSAATYYAAADIIDSQENMSENRNPTAEVWDKKAEKLTQSYIKQCINSAEDSDSPQSYHHGLSDNKRPFRGYMRSHPRKRWY